MTSAAAKPPRAAASAPARGPGGPARAATRRKARPGCVTGALTHLSALFEFCARQSLCQLETRARAHSGTTLAAQTLRRLRWVEKASASLPCDVFASFRIQAIGTAHRPGSVSDRGPSELRRAPVGGARARAPAPPPPCERTQYSCTPQRQITPHSSQDVTPESMGLAVT
eukprot:3014591-Prymnesium_polylepis.2